MQKKGSDDGQSWDMVRADSVNQCKKGRVSEHDGWAQVTKFVKIIMKDRRIEQTYGLKSSRSQSQEVVFEVDLLVFTCFHLIFS